MVPVTSGDPRFRTASCSYEELLRTLPRDELLSRFEALSRLTDVALAALSLHDLLESILSTTRHVLGTDTATVLLCTPEGDRLAVRASQGLGDDVEDAVTIPLGSGIAGSVAVRRVAAIVDDVARVEVSSPRLRRLSSMMVAPLLVEGELLGILHTGTLAPRRFTDADLWLLQVAADRVALAIKHALLYDASREELAQRRAAQAALHESERRFRLLIESVVDYAIFMLDPQGRVASWNPGAERMKGYLAEEIVGRHFSTFYTPEDVARDYPAYELEVAAREGRWEDEGWRVRKDGSRFWANVVISAVRDEGGELLGFAKVTRDLTERRRQEEQREELLEREHAARVEAEAANRAKADFMATMSHELRTPLTAVLGYADLLLSGIPEPLPEECAHQVERIALAGSHLQSLIEEILTFTRVEAQKEPVIIQDADLAAVALEAAALIEPAARDKELAFEISLPQGPLGARTDAVKVRQILLSLLGNAVKFTRRGGVTLSLAGESGAAVFRVRDTGHGVAPEHRDRIFEPFWQAEQTATRTAGGTGLGLTVARRLAELVGATLELEATSPVGSTFVLRLPLSPAPGQA